MDTSQLLLRLPPDLVRRLHGHVPARGRSAFVQRLLEQALPAEGGPGDPLYEAAVAVERDEALTAEMAEWEACVGDGLEPQTSLPPRQG